MRRIFAITVFLGLFCASQSDANGIVGDEPAVCPTAKSTWQIEPVWSHRSIDAAATTVSQDVLTIAATDADRQKQHADKLERLKRREAVSSLLRTGAAALSLQASEYLRSSGEESATGLYQVGNVVEVAQRRIIHPTDWHATHSGAAFTYRVRVDGAIAVRLMMRASVALNAYAIGSSGTILGPFRIDESLSWTGLAVGDEFSLAIFESDNIGIGDKAFEIAVSAVEVLDERFEPARHLAAQFTESTKSYCNDPLILPCMVNASCYGTSDFSAITAARQATASLHYVVGSGSFLCTGNLLNDADPDSVVPYLLTANHCISTQASASSLELYWDYSTPCNSTACTSSTLITQTGGADLLSTGARPGLPDYTLLRLRTKPPVGAGRSYLPVHSGAVGEVFVYRISHPYGKPQSFTRSIIRGSDWIGSGACPTTLPYPGFLYSTLSVGATQGGSSGSALMLPSGAVIGQLFGSCVRGNTCSQDWDVDGQMFFTYPRISPYLQQIDLIARRGFE